MRKLADLAGALDPTIRTSTISKLRHWISVNDNFENFEM